MDGAGAYMAGTLGVATLSLFALGGVVLDGDYFCNDLGLYRVRHREAHARATEGNAEGVRQSA